ncbi:MAG TPA: pyridine nucleotide-disulfide oxidoreductase, partial [Wenzhouxiangella sp.]
KTSNKRIFAIGDVTGGPMFTHVAGYQAGIIIKQVCFKLRFAKVNYQALPWVTYTDPELAHVGLTEVQARKQFGEQIKIVRWSMADNDRAVAEDIKEGEVKVIATPKGKILGVSIIGPQAGELIAVWTLMINQGLKIGAMAQVISPYPTLGEISKRAAGSWYTPSLFSEKTRRLVKLLSKLPF